MRMARESAGNDMLKVMQTVFPITVQIQMDVIKNYGFTADGDGMYYIYLTAIDCMHLVISAKPGNTDFLTDDLFHHISLNIKTKLTSVSFCCKSHCFKTANV